MLDTSSYQDNIFFKHEREKILCAIPDASNEECPKKENSDDSDGPSANRIKGERPGDSGEQVTEEEEKEGDINKKDVAHNPSMVSTYPSGKKKTPHGKIGFESLAKTIGARWKELPPEQLENYKAEAEKDSQRYAAEMEDFNKRLEEERRVGINLGGIAGLLESTARSEAQKIVSTVVGSQGSAPAVGPHGKKRRGRRPRDSLLDPEALASWTAQCTAMATPASTYMGAGGSGYTMPGQMGMMPYMGYQMVPVMPGMMGALPSVGAMMPGHLKQGVDGSSKNGQKGE